MNFNPNFHLILNTRAQSFHVDDRASPQQKSVFSRITHIDSDYESTLQNLKDIETVVKNSWNYDGQDNFSKWGKEIIYLDLTQKAKELTESYKQKFSKKNWITRFFLALFFKQNVIEETEARIEKVGKWLNLAHQLGYSGHNTSEAEAYLTELRSEIILDQSGVGLHLKEKFHKEVAELSLDELEQGLSSLNERQIYEFFESSAHQNSPLRNCLCHLIDFNKIKKMAPNEQAQVEESQTRALIKAIDAKDQQKFVQFLLAHGADVNAKDSDGTSVLQHAARARDIKSMELLVKAGAKINHKNKRGETALICACQEKGLNAAEQKKASALVNFLLSHGARDRADKAGRKAFDYALRNNYHMIQSDFNRAFFNQKLDQLQEHLESGLRVDKEIILRVYPSLIEKAKELGLQENDPSNRRLQTLLNSYYIENLIDQIEQGQLPVPSSIELLLNRLGLNNIEKEQMRETLIKQLQDYLKVEKRSLLEKSSPEFVQQMERLCLETVGTQLSKVRPKLKNLHPLMTQLVKFESEAQKKMQQAEHDLRGEIAGLLSGKGGDEQVVQILRQRWQEQTFPSLIPQLLKKFFTKINLEALPSSAEIEKILKQIQSEASSSVFKDDYEELVVKPFLDEAVGELKMEKQREWLKKNQPARCFAFDQAQWGEQQILGEGICIAINYRWIRHLLHHPAEKITSAAQMGATKKEEVGVTAQDRMHQASYQVGRRLAGGDVHSMGTHVLKRDHLKFTLVESEKPSIDALIDDVVKNHSNTLNSPETNGIFTISAYQTQGELVKNGHALGMQIDKLHGKYRFWDVNSGFYEYSSLKEMKDAFSHYLKAFYSKHNLFYAGQYSPAT